MGYVLTIGEATLDILDEDQETVEIIAQVHEVDAVDKHLLTFGEPTDGRSERWPSITSWTNFIQFVDIEEFRGLFYDEYLGWMRASPRIKLITPRSQGIINRTYDAFVEKYPQAVPRIAILKNTPENPPENQALIRLTWLKYWVNWAMKNCKMPVFHLG